MSERKQKTLFKSGNTNSNAKTTLQSAQKPTPLKHKKVKQETLPNRNLMPQFQKLQPTPIKPLKQQSIKQDNQRKSQINDSSEMSSQLNAESIIEISLKEEDYNFQLPRSYIIAMGGLQQAVTQRDAELKNLKLTLEQENKQKEVLEQKAQKLSILQKGLEKQNIELLAEIKLLKQFNIQEKQNQSNNQKSKHDLELELAVLKQKSTAQIGQLSRKIDFLEVEKGRLHQEAQQLKSQRKKANEQIQTLQKQIIRNNESFSQVKISMKNQVQKINKELEKEKEMRKEAQREINLLKNQISLLAERTVIAQIQHQQSLIAQKTFHESVQKQLAQRAPLVDVSLKNKTHQNKSKQQINIKVKTEIANQLQNGNQMPKLPLHSKKPTQNSFISRERSTSRMRVQQNRPQLVSQYRQLLRYQKESIALNYQLELLQKSLAGQTSGEGRSQLQRSYQKLKRQSEQKELQIRQLKCFLNDAGK